MTSLHIIHVTESIIFFTDRCMLLVAFPFGNSSRREGVGEEEDAITEPNFDVNSGCT